MSWRLVTAPARWVSISLTNGSILPGQHTAISVTILVDATAAAQLNLAHRSDLSDLLVISLGPKDLFLSVSAAQYLPTCFCTSLSLLSRLSQPIRRVSREEVRRLVAELDESDQKREATEIPRELLRMFLFLAEYGTETDGLFETEPGDEKISIRIRECLDTVSDSFYIPCKGG